MSFEISYWYFSENILMSIHIFHSRTCILTHWGQVTHICVGNLTIIGSDNGLSPGRRQAIIWTNAGILLIGHLGTNFNEIVIRIQTFSVKKMHLRMSSGKWRPLCLGLNVFNTASKLVTILFKPQRVEVLSSSELRAWMTNYANPVYGVATICHQVRWLRWGHPSLFHTATSLLV